ncbi:hypothetical protein, partial [Noviherbaspirillum sp. ST9]|uniref:hypothetical protein n=1 Tax=Noviherbaspirillum sp. ST9 TaxID=3401606 RepID=UPI003B585B6D
NLNPEYIIMDMGLRNFRELFYLKAPISLSRQLSVPTITEYHGSVITDDVGPKITPGILSKYSIPKMHPSGWQAIQLN